MLLGMLLNSLQVRNNSGMDITTMVHRNIRLLRAGLLKSEDQSADMLEPSKFVKIC